MRPGKMPKASDATRELFSSVVPEAPGVTTRPMFGQLAAFVNGNMFMGIFGDAIMLRLPEDDRSDVMAQGGRPFEPVAGRVMKEYVVVPDEWWEDRTVLEEWVGRSLEWAAALPPKAKKKRKS